jgi:hypothetical protein
LFGGAYFASRQWAAIVPLLAMLVSDLALALNGAGYATYLGGVSFWSVYACIAVSVVLGSGCAVGVTGARVLAYALTGSVLFFAATNFHGMAVGSAVSEECRRTRRRLCRGHPILPVDGARYA